MLLRLRGRRAFEPLGDAGAIMTAQSATEISEGLHYVSTGHLPPSDLVAVLVREAYQRFKSNTEGENSKVYPALARVQRDLFGVCVVSTAGNVYPAGDADHRFAIMGVSKPFVFALVCQAIGPKRARQKLGANMRVDTEPTLVG